MPRHQTNPVKELALQLFREGKTTAEVREITGEVPRKLQKWRHDAGIVPAHDGSRTTLKSMRGAACYMAKRGRSAEDISRRLGIDLGQVEAWIAGMGAEPKLAPAPAAPPRQYNVASRRRDAIPRRRCDCGRITDQAVCACGARWAALEVA